MTEAQRSKKPFSKGKGISAALITAILVVVLEVISIASRAGSLVQAGYFFVPAIVAILFYRGWIERLVAFVLLGIFGLAAAALAVAVFLG